MPGLPRSGAAARTPGSSACTMSSAPSRAVSARTASRSAGSSRPNSGTPESARNALKPNTPASCSRPGRPGCRAPRRPRSPRPRCADGRAAARLTASAAVVVVGGRLFSGMSISVVTPPAAAALVAVAKPSHSVRPGSLTCTWVSTRPGSSTSEPGSSSVLDRVQGRPGPGDRGDAPVADGHRHRPHPVRGDRPPRPDHQFVLGHARSLPARRPQPTLLPPWPCNPDSFVVVGTPTTKEGVMTKGTTSSSLRRTEA